MTTLEIDTEGTYGNVENQIVDMDTEELLNLYDFFARNPTVFTTVANELMHRREHEVENLEYLGLVEDIDQRFR